MTAAAFLVILVVLFGLGVYVAVAMGLGSLVLVTIFGDRIPPLGWAGIVVIVASGLIALRVEKKDQVEEAGFES